VDGRGGEQVCGREGDVRVECQGGEGGAYLYVDTYKRPGFVVRVLFVGLSVGLAIHLHIYLKEVLIHTYTYIFALSTSLLPPHT
jgi:hypothetical protein